MFVQLVEAGEVKHAGTVSVVWGSSHCCCFRHLGVYIFCAEIFPLSIFEVIAVYSVNIHCFTHLTSLFYTVINSAQMHYFVAKQYFFNIPKPPHGVLCELKGATVIARMCSVLPSVLWHSSAVSAICPPGSVCGKCGSQIWVCVSPDYICTTCGWINRRQGCINRRQVLDRLKSRPHVVR